MLGIVGLPLIVYAGSDSPLPSWTYQAGLAATVALGTITALKTSGAVRILAVAATALLASLCMTQIVHDRRTPQPGPGGTGPRHEAGYGGVAGRVPNAGGEAVQMTEENQ